MNRQKVFLEMMETLIGKQINFEDIIGQSKDALEENCAKLSSEVGNPFTVDMDNGNEPCPFYCSSIDKPFDFVFIGINPGRALEHHNELGFSWQNTTWQDLVDFCVPISDIRSHEKNGYQFVSKNNVGSDYYNFFLRFHVALTGGEVFNTLKELENRYGNPEKFFIEHIASYSILNADLVPYKYKETPNFNAENLINDSNYGNYFRKLINFIEMETKHDAWIIFYGKTGYYKNKKAFGTRDLLEKFAPHWNVPKKDDFFPITVIKKDGKKSDPRYFCFFKKGQRKILLSPFLSGKYKSPIFSNLNPLIDAMKELENK